MTILTPNFAQTNGAGGAVHITPAHEPLKTGEAFAVTTGGTPMIGHMSVATPPPVKPPLKIAMVGTAPSSKMLAPYNDPSWTIWGCSPGNMNQLPRVDAWFELHSNLLWPEHKSYGEPYIAWLKQQAFPIYMQDQSLVERAVVFPKDELVAEYGDIFFTSSFAWMMALAMKLGAAEIALYGIDMASRDEYIRQRPGFYFFKWQAEQRGVKVSAPHESDIMQSPPLYAYVDSTPFGRKIMARRAEVSGRVSGMVQQRDQLTHNITYLQGAQEDLDYFESIWGGVSNDLGRLDYENRQLKVRIAELEKAAIPQVLQAAAPPWLPIAAAQPVITLTAGPPPKQPTRKRREHRPHG